MKSTGYKNKKVVCLGGGIGTVNLIKGLKNYFTNITVAVSMADEGGSSGRLRKLYKIFPPGDLISCIAAMSSNKEISKLLTYRFPGDRYSKNNNSLNGQKLGNLMMVAARDITGDFNKAVKFLQKMLNVSGNFFPSTSENVSISAKTTEGKQVYGEEKIDLGEYNGKRILDKIFLHPANVKADKNVIKALKEADIIIAGPGDLYTTTLPVIIIPEICKILKKSKAQKFFIINVANKPFETAGYNVSDYISAVKRHIGEFPFNKIIINDNFSPKIPRKFQYHYVKYDGNLVREKNNLIKRNLIDENFPLYHDPDKLANALLENI